MAEVRAIVETGTYRYDFCEGIGLDVASVLEEGDFLEELDLSGDTEQIPDHLKSQYFIGSNVVAFILAYRTDKFSKPITHAIFGMLHSSRAAAACGRMRAIRSSSPWWLMA